MGKDSSNEIDNLEADIAQSMDEKSEEITTESSEEVEEEIIHQPSIQEKIELSGIKTYDEQEKVIQAKIDIFAEDITDRHSIIFFGIKTQENLHKLSTHMLKISHISELATIESNLKSTLKELREFDLDKLNPTKKQGLFSKLFGFATPQVKFISCCNELHTGLDNTISSLRESLENIEKDCASLEKLHLVGGEFIKDLDNYILAGANVINTLTDELTPLQEEANGNKKLIKKLKINDKKLLLETLSARVDDLLTSRALALDSIKDITTIKTKP